MTADSLWAGTTTRNLRVRVPFGAGVGTVQPARAVNNVYATMTRSRAWALNAIPLIIG
jgi:hypothetical protein